MLAQSNGLNTVFTTFLEITATSIAAQMDPQNAEEREKKYQEMASKMTPEMLSSYARMFALLTLATREHAEDPCDILGEPQIRVLRSRPQLSLCVSYIHPINIKA